MCHTSHKNMTTLLFIRFVWWRTFIWKSRIKSFTSGWAFYTTMHSICASALVRDKCKNWFLLGPMLLFITISSNWGRELYWRKFSKPSDSLVAGDYLLVQFIAILIYCLQYSLGSLVISMSESDDAPLHNVSCGGFKYNSKYFLCLEMIVLLALGGA